MARIEYTRGTDLMREVRIGFIRQNTTMTAWCKQHGIHPSAARQAVIGTWAGEKGNAMLNRIIAAAGLDARAAA